MLTHLAFSPVLVHRGTTLSASAILCVETAPPGHHEDEPGGGCQWLRRSGVPPDFIMAGARNKWSHPVAIVLQVPIPIGDGTGIGLQLGPTRFVLCQAVPVGGKAQPAKRATRHQCHSSVDTNFFPVFLHPVRIGHGIGLSSRCDLDGSPEMDHGSFPMPVCVRRTPPVHPCVWPSVRCWSTGEPPDPHPQRRAWKQHRLVTKQ